MQALPDDFVVEGIAADHLGIERTPRRNRGALCPARDAGIGDHLDHAERPLARRAHGVGERILHRVYRRIGLDVGDFHGVVNGE